mgnify:CR=1 FL=1
MDSLNLIFQAIDFKLIIALVVIVGALKALEPLIKGGRDKDNKSVSIAKKGRFYAQGLLNQSEQKAYKALIRGLKELNTNYLIYPQVSLGEIIRTDRNNISAFNIINSKRVDFLIVDTSFNPVMAVEYHGSGHFKGNYKTRDQVKEIALTKAGIKYVALHYKNDAKIAEHIKNEILDVLEPPVTESASTEPPFSASKNDFEEFK